MATKAQQAATKKYNQVHYEEIKIRVPFGKKFSLKMHAESRGLSLNGYINKLIARDNLIPFDEVDKILLACVDIIEVSGYNDVSCVELAGHIHALVNLLGLDVSAEQEGDV